MNMKKYIFMLTYNEQDFWIKNYPKDFVDAHFKPHNFHFIVLDNGNQPRMKQWCEENSFTYYASEHNIGSSGGYNWAFKVAYSMNLDTALFMQADVEVSNAEPLLLTYNLTKADGANNFYIWPQNLYGFWLDSPVNEPWINEPLHNLGNLVGFNSLAQFKYNCYFDENYVVTHIDDMEFLQYLSSNNVMKFKNVAEVCNLTNQFYSKGLPGFAYANFPYATGPFTIDAGNSTFTVHHASQTFQVQQTGEHRFHEKWLEINEPYYRNCYGENCEMGRKPYDPSRWTRFGYPPYPVLHEINRFFVQYPELNVNGLEPWKIPNE